MLRNDILRYCKFNSYPVCRFRDIARESHFLKTTIGLNRGSTFLILTFSDELRIHRWSHCTKFLAVFYSWQTISDIECRNRLSKTQNGSFKVWDSNNYENKFFIILCKFQSHSGSTITGLFLHLTVLLNSVCQSGGILISFYQYVTLLRHCVN